MCVWGGSEGGSEASRAQIPESIVFPQTLEFSSIYGESGGGGETGNQE